MVVSAFPARVESSGLTVGPVTDWGIMYIAHHLREADRREAIISTGYQHSPAYVLETSVSMSEVVFMAKWNEEPFAIFGVVEGGKVWMMGTPTMEEIPPKTVVLASRKWLSKLQTRYGVLWNFVLKANEVHVRWLEAMGFEFLREVQWPCGAKFIEFRR